MPSYSAAERQRRMRERMRERMGPRRDYYQQPRQDYYRQDSRGRPQHHADRMRQYGRQGPTRARKTVQKAKQDRHGLLYHVTGTIEHLSQLPGVDILSALCDAHPHCRMGKTVATSIYHSLRGIKRAL